MLQLLCYSFLSVISVYCSSCYYNNSNSKSGIIVVKVKLIATNQQKFIITVKMLYVIILLLKKEYSARKNTSFYKCIGELMRSLCGGNNGLGIFFLFTPSFYTTDVEILKAGGEWTFQSLLDAGPELGEAGLCSLLHTEQWSGHNITHCETCHMLQHPTSLPPKQDKQGVYQSNSFSLWIKPILQI